MSTHGAARLTVVRDDGEQGSPEVRCATVATDGGGGAGGSSGGGGCGCTRGASATSGAGAEAAAVRDGVGVAGGGGAGGGDGEDPAVGSFAPGPGMVWLRPLEMPGARPALRMFARGWCRGDARRWAVIRRRFFDGRDGQGDPSARACARAAKVDHHTAAAWIAEFCDLLETGVHAEMLTAADLIEDRGLEHGQEPDEGEDWASDEGSQA